jgi:hypothetical protein
MAVDFCNWLAVVNMLCSSCAAAASAAAVARAEKFAWKLIDLATIARIGEETKVVSGLGLLSTDTYFSIQGNNNKNNNNNNNNNNNVLTVPQVYTREYVSPEVAQAVVGGAVSIVAQPSWDLWGIGIIMWELATGGRR